MNAVRFSSQSNHYSSFRRTVANLTTPRVTKAALAAFVALANFFIFPLEIAFPISLLTTCFIYSIGSLWNRSSHQGSRPNFFPFVNPIPVSQPYFSDLPPTYFPSRIPVSTRTHARERIPVGHAGFQQRETRETVGEAGRRRGFAIPRAAHFDPPSRGTKERESIDPRRS